RNGRYLHRQVESIAQGAGEPALIPFQLLGRAAAFAAAVAAIPVGTGIGGADQNEACRKSHRASGTGHRDPSLLERLAEDIEHAAMELEHFVEEQHAMVSKADLARPRLRAAAGERDVRDGVMWRPEGTVG